MRSARLIILALLVTLTGGLTACGADDSSGDSSAPAAKASAIPVQLPPVRRDKWRTAGDLCRSIDGAYAQQMLTHASELAATFVPASDGDGCTYVDRSTSPGYAAQLKVQKAAPNAGKTARNMLAAGKYPVQEFAFQGTDEAFFGNDQAIVIKGGLMATVTNPSGGKFSPTSLIRLAGVALSTMS